MTVSPKGTRGDEDPLLKWGCETQGRGVSGWKRFRSRIECVKKVVGLLPQRPLQSGQSSPERHHQCLAAPGGAACQSPHAAQGYSVILNSRTFEMALGHLQHSEPLVID